jgi:hypothetical protein
VDVHGPRKKGMSPLNALGRSMLSRNGHLVKLLMERV